MILRASAWVVMQAFRGWRRVTGKQVGRSAMEINDHTIEPGARSALLANKLESIQRVLISSTLWVVVGLMLIMGLLATIEHRQRSQFEALRGRVESLEQRHDGRFKSILICEPPDPCRTIEPLQ